MTTTQVHYPIPLAACKVESKDVSDLDVANNVTTAGYTAQYTLLIEGIHTVWPQAQIILIVSLL